MIYFIKETVIAKILVTGATGFVGSHILESLMAIEHTGVEIVAACRRPEKLLTAYKGEIRVGDLRDADYLDRLLAGVDIVCHAAGWSSFLSDGQASREQYLEPTLELINHAVEWRVSRFVNLSSIAAAGLKHRNNADCRGQPRRYWPMINCMIAVEDYLRAQTTRNSHLNCSVVNLRCGIYSGTRLGTTSPLPLLFSRIDSPLLPCTGGRYGYLPLVDGRDIGQAFVRAALAPLDTSYTSLNIVGPDTPSQKQVMDFLGRQSKQSAYRLPLPAIFTQITTLAIEHVSHNPGQKLFTRSLNSILTNPLIYNDKAISALGYDPEISWQASLQSFLDHSQKTSAQPELQQAVTPLNSYLGQ
ncbi:MAG: NAD(P)-dependent oxidoreductase [Gammaproteobacteria bacterium]|nr:NAD(P)-dependent oxidoreductase [Gammaproteobacteria bacterium]